MAPTNVSPMQDNRVFRLRQGRSLWIGGAVLIVIIALGSMALRGNDTVNVAPSDTVATPGASQPATQP